MLDSTQRIFLVKDHINNFEECCSEDINEIYVKSVLGAGVNVDAFFK